MKLFFFVLSFVFLGFSATAQSGYFYVTGTVINAEDELPLQGASVFAQGTTLGTATDADGKFSLALPDGAYDLVITFSGMKTESKRVSSTERHTNLYFKLELKENELEEVAVVATTEVKEGWKEYGQFFLHEFIGQTPNSTQTYLRNPETLKFYFSKRRNRLKIIAKNALEIENHALGYKVKYALDSFTYDYDTKVSLYTGYPIFEQMETEDVFQIKDWETTRKQAYEGSILHFMRSVYRANIAKQGFEVQFLIHDKTKAVAVKDPYLSMQYLRDTALKVVRIKPKQITMGVIYAGLKPEANYIAQFPKEPKTFQFSTLNFKKDANIFIAQNGYFYEQNNVGISGYWAWNKVADMLPSNFDPTIETKIDYAAINARAAQEQALDSEEIEVAGEEPLTRETAEPEEYVRNSEVSAEPPKPQETAIGTEEAGMKSCMTQHESDIARVIKKSISIDAMLYENKIAEHYTIEISRDKITGEIHFDFYRKSNARHFKQIEQAIEALKSRVQTSQFCDYQRLIIPVSIIFDGESNTLAPVNSLFQNDASNKTFVFETITLKVYSRD